jgi:Na+-transporting NADH:ubiquinone oxidoreductase subunit F
VLEAALGVLLLTALVVGLAAAVVAARALLAPRQAVAVTVNTRAPIHARAGARLLGVLRDAGVEVPSACGGVGTCGLCRVTVVDGGDPPHPTEVARLARRDVAAGVRLACLTTVRRDLRVRIADEVLGAQRRRCAVVSARTVAGLIKEVVLALPPGETLAFRAGAFVQVTRPPGEVRFRDVEVAPAHRGVWDAQDLWRLVSSCTSPTVRAYSLANPPADATRVLLLVRLALPPSGAPADVPPGLVSSYLFAARPGDVVEVGGPFGEFFAPETPPEREMVLLGGGVGMAPLRSILLDQLERRRSTRPITFWYGARSRRDLFYVEELDALAAAHPNFRWHAVLSEPALDDAWTGPTGFVHRVAFERHLGRHPAPEDCEYYLCGPPLMIEAVRAMLDGLGVDPQSVRFDDFGSSR